MTMHKWVRVIAWVVLAGALVGAAGAYRYFITPFELRSGTGEAVWAALGFAGDAVLAGALLLLLRESRS